MHDLVVHCAQDKIVGTCEYHIILAFFTFNEICTIVVILQTQKVTGFRTMTQADVPLAFRLVTEVCMADGVKSV